jgi:hypothetical protein
MDRSVLRTRLGCIAQQPPRLEYRRTDIMLGLEWRPVDKKRMRRVNRFEVLQLRTRICRRAHVCLHRGVVRQAERKRECCSLEFAHNELFDGRLVTMVTVPNWHRCQTLDAGPRFSFGGQNAVAAIDRAIEPASGRAIR